MQDAMFGPTPSNEAELSEKSCITAEWILGAPLLGRHHLDEGCGIQADVQDARQPLDMRVYPSLV
jgi:hypothetical protein